MLTRKITPHIEAALADTPVVLVHGPRQAGKSTLVQYLAATMENIQYFTFDEAQILSLAKADPEAFLAGLTGAIILDEVQRVPEIFLAIKLMVDRNRKPGQFLLTGSANVLLLPQMADSLAGRMEMIPLLPFALTELNQSPINFIDAIFSPHCNVNASTAKKEADLWPDILRGGYPEIITRPNEQRRQAWFEAYLSSILSRDVKNIANIEGLTELPHLLSLVATRCCGLLNFSELSRSSKLPQTTLKRYMSLLEMTFLTSLLKPWSNNLNKRFVKAPKMMLNDTGVLAHLLGVDSTTLPSMGNQRGMLLENAVYCELYKQKTWSELRTQLYHYRSHDGSEVDFVLESADKRIVGIEVKAASRISAQDFKGLKDLAEIAGVQFHRGIVLYTGDKMIPFGPHLLALPVTSLY